MSKTCMKRRVRPGPTARVLSPRSSYHVQLLENAGLVRKLVLATPPHGTEIAPKPTTTFGRHGQRDWWNSGDRDRKPTGRLRREIGDEAWSAHHTVMPRAQRFSLRLIAEGLTSPRPTRLKSCADHFVGMFAIQPSRMGPRPTRKQVCTI